MQAANQTGFIGVETERHQINLEVFGLEDDVGARDREFADPALAKAAADHDAFGVGPGFGPEKSARHMGQFLRELLDRAVYQCGGADVVADQGLVERGLGDGRSGFVAERILAAFLQRLAQRVQYLAEGALAGAVAQKALVVLQFEIIAVHVHRWQARGAVPGDARCHYEIFSHFRLAPWELLGTTAAEPVGFTGKNKPAWKMP